MCVLALVIGVIAAPVSAKGPARMPAIGSAADRVMDLQRTDLGWEGTWYWYVGSTYNATNLTGVTALGLLEAHRDGKDAAYLAAAEDAAGFIIEHLGSAATGAQYHIRATAADVVFLFRLAEVTGNADYAAAATSRWNDIKASYPTAGDLDARFRAINRQSAWDIAFFLEAAHLAGDTSWADDAAAILADTTDAFYYGSTWWLALNYGGAIRALVGCGYGELYRDGVVEMLGLLAGMLDDAGSIDGYVQDTAYAVMAFAAVGGAARPYANDLARWLAATQKPDGGWVEPDGYEYPEADGEALRALASSIGSNSTIKGFASGPAGSSAWRSSANRAVPFTMGG